MPPAVSRLRRDHPGVRIDLKLIDPGDPKAEVEQGRADLAIVVVIPGSASGSDPVPTRTRSRRARGPDAHAVPTRTRSRRARGAARSDVPRQQPGNCRIGSTPCDMNPGTAALKALKRDNNPETDSILNGEVEAKLD